MPTKSVPSARRVSVIGALAALTASTLITGCTTHTDPQIRAGETPVTTIGRARDSSGPAPAIAGAKRGGTITVLMNQDFEHLDPGRTYTSDAQLANLLTQRTLTAYRRLGPGRVELVGDLATDTGRSTDGGRTWAFTLRDGLKFEDGTPITSADVAYAVARSFSDALAQGPSWLQEWLAGNPDYNAAYKGPFAGGAALPPGVTTPDAKTIVFSFKTPRPDMPLVATFGTTTPVPRKRDTKVNYDRKPIATGPYKIASYAIGTKLVLTRNQYWDPNTDPVRQAYPDGFEFVMGQTPETATQRLLHETPADATAISASMVPAEAVAQVLADKAVYGRATSGETPYVGMLKINTERVRDLTVRRALNCAFNRVAYTKVLGGELVAEPATTIQPRVVSGYRNFNAYDCGPNGDPARAKKMLNGARPTLKYGYRNNTRGQNQNAFMQDTLGKAGFNIVGVPLDPGHYYDLIGTHGNGLDIYMATWSSDWPSGSTVLPALLDGRTIAKTGNKNTSYFNDPAVNAEIDRILVLDSEAAGKAWSDLEQKIMREHAPLVPVYYDKTFMLNGSRVGGLFLDGLLGGTSLVNAYVKSARQ